MNTSMRADGASAAKVRTKPQLDLVKNHALGQNNKRLSESFGNEWPSQRLVLGVDEEVAE